MALTAIDGTPLVILGAANRNGVPQLTTLTSTTVDAVNEACIMVGRVFWSDLGSHTVDTSGSSALEWRTGTSTFSSASTTVKVGLATPSLTVGPPVRAANASDVITFDVSKTMAGNGGGITSTAWQTHVPDAGTKTIAHGDLVAFAVQMTARGAADSVLVSTVATFVVMSEPSVTDFTGGAYSGRSAVPNVVITASDGTVGTFFGSHVASVGSTTQVWNNTSGTKEYGNLIQVPFPTRCYGIIAGASIGGDTDLILYSDPLGTPAAQRTLSMDGNAIGNAALGNLTVGLFATTYDMAANTVYGAIMKPTSATNCSLQYKTFNAAAHQKSDYPFTNCYAINRASGAFAAQNSNKDRFAIGLLVGAFDNGVSSSPVGEFKSFQRGTPY